MNKPYFVRAEWDSEAAVWVATSDDVPGLVTEAETIEALDAKLKNMVPELLEANGCKPADGQVSVELLARRFSVTLSSATARAITISGTRRAAQRPSRLTTRSCLGIPPTAC